MGKALVQIMLFVLPWPLRRWLLCRLFGFEIAPSAKIGFSLILADHLTIGENARITHLTVIKGLQSVTVEESGIIGTLNWVTATPYGDPTHFALETGRSPSLYVERHAAITSRHMIDCTDRVTIGAFAILAGWRSQILTHAIDFKMGRQTCAPVKIGRYSFVGTRCVLLKGSVLPDKSVLAAGSVLTRAMSEEGTLYGGSPAAALRAIDTQGKYFTREDGFVT